MGMDLKYKDYTADNLVLTAPAVWQLAKPTHSKNVAETPQTWSGVTQGDTQNSRDGSRYLITSFQARVTITQPKIESALSPIADFSYRVIFFIDKQTNGAVAPTSAGVLEIIQASESAKLGAYRDLEHTSRFTVLFDTGVKNFRQGEFNEGGINLFSCQFRRQYHKFIKTGMKVPVQTTNSGTNNVSAITDNNIQCMYNWIAAEAAPNDPTISISTRMRFRG